MAVISSSRDHYLVGAFLQAHQVMTAFRPRETLRLRDVVDRTGLAKGTAFRLLHTLHSTGFVEKTDPNRYRLRVEMPRQIRYRFGFDMNGSDTGFTRVVAESLALAAGNLAELLVLDNQDGRLSLHNADLLVAERVDLVIVFQGDISIACELAAKYDKAKIPIIAVDVPHPGAYFFGANNFRAGMLAGHHMGKWARKNWSGQIPDVVLIEYNRAGPVTRSRIAGMLAGFRETFPENDRCAIFHLDSFGDYPSSFEAAQMHVRRNGGRKTLVGAVNDHAARGALAAFSEARIDHLCAVASQDAAPAERAEMRRQNSRIIGSVAYFPERYGYHIISLARKILAGSPAPFVTFTRHLLVTPENVDRVYPNDMLLPQCE